MKLIVALLVPQLAGIVGTIFTVKNIPYWYANLNKPSFSPPNWIFGPVWIVLYLLMGISLYLNWVNKGAQAKFNVRLFFVHLIYNAIWSPIFFGARNPLLALMVIAVMWLLIVLMIVKFHKTNKTSAYLLIPYLLWVSFASVLNYFVWKLN